MVGATEKQKLVYTLNRDSSARLTISSPLEAHKTNTLTFHMVGVGTPWIRRCHQTDYRISAVASHLDTLIHHSPPDPTPPLPAQTHPGASNLISSNPIQSYLKSTRPDPARADWKGSDEIGLGEMGWGGMSWDELGWDGVEWGGVEWNEIKQ